MVLLITVKNTHEVFCLIGGLSIGKNCKIFILYTILVYLELTPNLTLQAQTVYGALHGLQVSASIILVAKLSLFLTLL